MLVPNDRENCSWPATLIPNHRKNCSWPAHRAVLHDPIVNSLVSFVAVMASSEQNPLTRPAPGASPLSHLWEQFTGLAELMEGSGPCPGAAPTALRGLPQSPLLQQGPVTCPAKPLHLPSTFKAVWHPGLQLLVEPMICSLVSSDAYIASVVIVGCTASMKMDYVAHYIGLSCASLVIIMCFIVSMMVSTRVVVLVLE